MTSRIDPFHAIAISRRAHELKCEGRRIIHMEFGQPSTGAPAAAIARAHQVLDSDAMGYWENAALKERIGRYYAERHGVSVEPERIFLTCGASPALVLALHALFAPGARIAFARPGYVAYRNVTRALHMEPVEIECGPDSHFQLSARALAALDSAPDGIILSSPANPTGSVIPEGELIAIMDLCRERGIRVISDEIYHGLSYVGPLRSALELDPDALIVNSFSKYYSMAGWRLAGLVAFDCTDELEGHVATYRRNRDLLLNALPRLGLGRIAPPDGAFYIYADVSHLTDDSLAFCTELLEDTGVATAPGIDFDPVYGRGFIRFSFAVSTAEVEEALARIAPWFAARENRTG